MYLNNNTQPPRLTGSPTRRTSVTAASIYETPRLIGNNHTHFHDRVTVSFAGHPDFLAAVLVPQFCCARLALVATTEMVISCCRAVGWRTALTDPHRLFQSIVERSRERLYRFPSLITVQWLDPYAHAAELSDEGVRVHVVHKTEARVFHDSEHMAPSIWRLTVPPHVAEFMHFAHAIGRVHLDRDLMGKIAINLSLRNLTFASDHRRQE